MLYLLIQCDDCNRNTTLKQDKMLIKSVTLSEFFKFTTGLKQTKVSKIVSIFAIISEIVGSPHTRIK